MTEEGRLIRLILMRRIARHIAMWPRGKAVAMIGGDDSQARRDLGAIRQWDSCRDRGPKADRLIYICERLGVSALDAICAEKRAA